MGLASAFPERFQRWATVAADLGFRDFVSAEDGFRTCVPSGQPWLNSHACGIYFWVAENGETYVGQAVDAQARLRTHWRNHPDLTYAAFQVVPKALLNEREEKLIRQVGSVLLTRNIKHAFDTDAHVPFDQFVSEAERVGFLTGTPLPDASWRELPLLEQKQAKKMARFNRLPERDAILGSLGAFISDVIPRPASTEARFWSATLFAQHILRINAGQQEVFTVHREQSGGLISRLLTTKPFGLRPEGPFYKTMSYEVSVPIEGTERWLSGSGLLSCRELVVRLMRHTTTLNSGSHCPQVARAAVASAT